MPKPYDGHGWLLNDDGGIGLKWTEHEVMPKSLVDILEKQLSFNFHTKIMIVYCIFFNYFII